MKEDCAGSKPALRLLIVSNHGMIRGGLVSLFQVTERIEPAATATTLAVRVARQLLPHVALIDLGTDADAAFSAAESIAAEVPDVRLLFIDDTVRQDWVRAAVKTGARGYWTTQASFRHITDAVRQVAAGETSFCPEVDAQVLGAADTLADTPASPKIDISDSA